VGGRTGGEDVIDEDNLLSVELLSMAFFDLEGVAEVRKTLFPVELGLGLGGAFADEGVGKSEVAELGEFAGQFVGLVSVPPLLPPPVEGDRNDEGIAKVAEALVFEKAFLKEGRKGAGEEEMTLVFQAMNEVEGGRQPFQGSARKVEIVGKSLAVLT